MLNFLSHEFHLFIVFFVMFLTSKNIVKFVSAKYSNCETAILILIFIEIVLLRKVDHLIFNSIKI
jgi:hypothetical protein